MSDAQIADSGAHGSGVAALVAGNSAFAFDLYQLLRQKEGNLCYSPYSLSLALAMAYAGARGETEKQMAGALHFSQPQACVHAAFQHLCAELYWRGEGATGRDGGGFRLRLANALWGQEGYLFLPAFLAVVEDQYGSTLRQLDFAADPELARRTVNSWAEEETEGRIPNLIAPGLIDALTRLVLTNAIYFNAAWAEPFEPALTGEAPFCRLDGSEISVPMMHHTGILLYGEGDGYQAVALPYDGRELSMIVLLPRAGRFASFEAGLDAARLEDLVQDMASEEVALSLPRFAFGSGFRLHDRLSALDMALAFSTRADFSGMTGSPGLFFSEVIHKAFVAVDEAGTEAAAATAVLLRLGFAAQPRVEVTVDRPFLFLIRDDATGAILFVGRVVDPSEE